MRCTGTMNIHTIKGDSRGRKKKEWQSTEPITERNRSSSWHFLNTSFLCGLPEVLSRVCVCAELSACLAATWQMFNSDFKIHSLAHASNFSEVLLLLVGCSYLSVKYHRKISTKSSLTLVPSSPLKTFTLSLSLFKSSWLKVRRRNISLNTKICLSVIQQ